jgi:hypothetical protein
LIFTVAAFSAPRRSGLQCALTQHQRAMDALRLNVIEIGLFNPGHSAGWPGRHKYLQAALPITFAVD